MKGGKDRVQVMSPVFARFHVNDTEKGGPRAPPRNKMALYEQFSIPSQSFNPGSPSVLPIPDSESSRMVPSTSSSGVSIHERNILIPPCNSIVVPSLSAEKIRSYKPSWNTLNTMMADCERISSKPSKYLNTTESSSLAAKCGSFQPNTASSFRNFSLKKYGNEDCIKVQTTFQGTALQCTNGQKSKKREDLSCLSSTAQSKSSCIKKMHGSNNMDMKSREYGRNQDEENPKVAHTNEDPVESLGTVKEISLKVQEKLLPNPSLGSGNRISGALGNDSECCEENRGVGNLCRHEDVSDMSTMDSNSAAGISPDDVIGVIGAEQFCKMRTAIVSQQRVFAVQVFELHRLIKVQRLIAGSPHLLLDDNELLCKPALQLPPVKKIRLEHVLESSPLSLKPKEQPQKPNSSAECVEESSVGKWCLQPPPGNLLFVPVMSPSEGLTYKPYTGPRPPAGVFMAPMYVSSGPTSLNAAYGVPSYQPPMLETYFSPYRMPMIKEPSASSSAFENLRPFEEMYFTMGNQNSCNIMPRQMRQQVMPCHTRNNVEASRVIELQGNTASSPSDQIIDNALPLFPTAPPQHLPKGAQNPQTSEYQTRAIKVVPHNSKYSSESAARIFLSIKEGRK